jgi:hypothetical protein
MASDEPAPPYAPCVNGTSVVPLLLLKAIKTKGAEIDAKLSEINELQPEPEVEHTFDIDLRAIKIVSGTGEEFCISIYSDDDVPSDDEWVRDREADGLIEVLFEAEMRRKRARARERNCRARGAELRALRAERDAMVNDLAKDA